MRKLFIGIFCLLSWGSSFAQVDTISTNIYQKNGNLGIGVLDLTHKLEIETEQSSGAERNLIKANNIYDGSTAYTGIILKTGVGNNQSVIQDYGINYSASSGYEFGGFLNLSNNANGLMLHANSEQGVIKFYTGHDATLGAGIERMRIDSEGKIGIGAKSPDYLLHLKSNSDESSSIPRQFLRLENENNGDHSNVAIALSSGTDENMSSVSFGVTAKSYALNGYGGYAYMYNVNNGILLRANNVNSKIRFFTGGDGEDFERMRIDSIGNVGIGTSKPRAKVEVADGDIYISDINKGIIMKSPDGQCWRGTLDNTGSLSFTQIDCPDVVTTNKMTEELSNRSSDISIFPNPANDFISIDLQGAELGRLSYNIYDISGRLMLASNLNSDLSTIDVSSLRKGIYLIKVTDGNDNQLSSEKFIKE